MAEPDFSGWASKNGIKCADGRTIMPGAFSHQDKQKVPLIWQHQHKDHAQVLGHGFLTVHEEGTWFDGYFNQTDSGRTAKLMVQNGDVDQMSIFAGQLQHDPLGRGHVQHGNIKEVSLVLSGANPEARIETISMRHSEDTDDLEEEEAIIYTGLPIETPQTENNVQSTAEVEHAPTNTAPPATQVEPTSQDDSATENSSTVEHSENLSHADTATETSSAASTTSTEGAPAVADQTVKDVFDAFTEEQKNVVYYLIGEAVTDAKGDDDELAQSDLDYQEGVFVPMGNVFDQNLSHGADFGPTLTHDELQGIVATAQREGSLKEAFLAHAEAQGYGIQDIDILFPDAKALTNSPDIIGRRTEWVSDVINGTKHSPFSRIKSTAVDLTADEARAKGYVKGSIKKDEIIKLLKRTTTPTTIYKKQKLDRDDIVDITDLDVVAWLKVEMRLMLDEELARAVLIGDGREADDDDKIDEEHIRPIAYDHDMYAHKVRIQDSSDPDTIVEGVIRARAAYKGTGTPTMYTTDEVLTDLILKKDKMGRRVYTSEADLASAMRVSKIVTVEVMADAPDILAIIVNLTDYTLGADTGGKVSMFDDFDIDYNQYKYLIETRVSGALTKPKSAVIVNRAVGTVVTPGTPSYNGATKTVTFPVSAGVVYRIDGVAKTGDVVLTETSDIEASPATGYTFPRGVVRDWTYIV
jgi:HK97 family phage prohead protease